MAVENTSSTLLPFNTMIHMVTIKLSSSNYLLWRSQLLPLLESQELLGHVDGTLAPPPRFAPTDSQMPNIKHLAWKKTDKHFLSLLLSSLTEEAMVEVVGLSTSCEVWLALENTFNHRSKAREIRLKDDLQLMRHGTRSVTEYAWAFKALCDQLHTIGRPVDDTDKVHWFLRGLGSNFTSFSTAQMAQMPLPSFPDLVSKAESFELFQKSIDNHDLPTAAFTTTNHSQPRSAFRNQSRHQSGRHSSSHRGNSRSNSGQGRHPPRCQICRQEGHYADKCNQRCAQGGEPVGTTVNLVEAFKASYSLNGPEPSDWYLDIGASAHMTPNLSHLDQASIYTGKDRVVVRNGASLPITHTESSIGKGGGLYMLECGNSAFIYVLKNKALHASYDLWHARLGHVSHFVISLLNKNGHLYLTSLLHPPSLCDTCQPRGSFQSVPPRRAGVAAGGAHRGRFTTAGHEGVSSRCRRGKLVSQRGRLTVCVREWGAQQLSHYKG
ncbi:hypothetical protein AAG906_040068 [Vitis piasezkii]